MDASSSSAQNKRGRGGLGDAGLNSRKATGEEQTANRGVDVDVNALIGSTLNPTANLLDESHVKVIFTEFVKFFGSEEGVGTATAASSETRSNAVDMMNVDLDAAAGARGAARELSAAGAGKYLLKLRRAVEGTTSTNDNPGTVSVDLHDIQQYDTDLYFVLVQEPANSIVFMDEVLETIAIEEFPEIGAAGVARLGLKVCLFNHPGVCCMRQLNPTDIETLVSVRGVVIRASHVVPDMQVASFRCSGRISANQQIKICGYEEERRLANGEVQEPLQCPRCNNKFVFQLIHTKCTFGNKQLLKIQETPESIPEGETPHTIMAYAYDELVDVCKPGDRIEATGIYKASGVRVLAKQRNLKAVYRTYLDVNHINKQHANQIQLSEGELSSGREESTEDSAIYFAPELVEKLKGLAKQPTIYEDLVKSLAPNIWEHEDVKKGLLCQLFGGASKQLGHRKSRAEVHILLCGDPSTAKSQLLQHVNHITPRGVYTCGRGTSAVGLTATVTRDTETREFVLESGAVVLSDRGICCVDEFDKMDDGARVILHEVMEQQTVSIAKAGIVCSINARTAILASANPIDSKYNTRRSVVDNINLPAALLSRFDLIYLILDNNDAHTDRLLAQHICSLYGAVPRSQKDPPPIDRITFTQYISYARNVCHPRLSPAAQQELVTTYLVFRRKGADASGKSLTATPRQLESLIRLSEALARIQLCDVVRVDHVKEAARLIQVATYAAVVDPTTGKIDFEQLNRGVSGESREQREAMESSICDILKELGGGSLDKENIAKRVETALASTMRITAEIVNRELDSCLHNLQLLGVVARTHTGQFACHV